MKIGQKVNYFCTINQTNYDAEIISFTPKRVKIKFNPHYSLGEIITNVKQSSLTVK